MINCVWMINLCLRIIIRGCVCVWFLFLFLFVCLLLLLFFFGGGEHSPRSGFGYPITVDEIWKETKVLDILHDNNTLYDVYDIHFEKRPLSEIQFIAGSDHLYILNLQMGNLWVSSLYTADMKTPFMTLNDTWRPFWKAPPIRFTVDGESDPL